ncbi:hypothetical protein, partial [Mailhella sp.]|uniref:hypothetical protein n=1 Tax=Mailhella sp. TaxID=1981029 RepID=UPI004062DFB0
LFCSVLFCSVLHGYFLLKNDSTSLRVACAKVKAFAYLMGVHQQLSAPLVLKNLPFFQESSAESCRVTNLHRQTGALSDKPLPLSQQNPKIFLFTPRRSQKRAYLCSRKNSRSSKRGRSGELPTRT